MGARGQKVRGRPGRRAGFIALAVIIGILVVVGAGTAAEEASESDRLFPDDNDQSVFGADAAVDGATAIVGAPRATNASGADTGAGYVFVQDGGTWSQQAKLQAKAPERNADVGLSVDVHGDTAILGAPDDGDATGADVGAAYVFTRDASGQWSQQAKLLASDGEDEDAFGEAVSVDNDTALIGAPEAVTSGGEGAVYVFTRSDGNWTEQTKLAPAEDHSSFGWALDLHNGTALVGDPDALNDTGERTGAAYVLQRTNGSWGIADKLVADDVEGFDDFGTSLDLEAERALVAADGADSSVGSNTGAAYVYHDDAGNWTVHAKLEPSDPDTGKFGDSVALAGDRALAGAPFEDFQGAGYLFERASSGAWSEDARLVPHGTDAERLGVSAVLTEDQAWLGDASSSNPDGFTTGAIYQYFAPAPPTNVTASPGGVVDAVTIEWDPPSDDASEDLYYHVYRSTTAGGPYEKVTRVQDTSYEDDRLENQTYYYVVTASVNFDSLQSDPSPEDSSLPMAPPPPALRARMACGTGEVLVEWTPPDAIDRDYVYHLERSTSLTGPYTEIATTRFDLEYRDTDLPDGTLYYRVIAESEGGMVSAPSQPDSVHPRPAAPGSLAASSDGAGSPIDLDWSPPTDGKTPFEYRIYRGSDAGGPFAFVATSETTSYVDASATPGTHHYVVTTVDADGRESLPAHPATAEGGQGLPAGLLFPIEDDAGTRGDASDDPADPTVLSVRGTVQFQASLVPGADPVDAYGIRVSPGGELGLEASFQSPLGMGLTARLVSPTGEVVDTDDAPLSGGRAAVDVQASPGETLAAGVWTVAVDHGVPPGDAAPGPASSRTERPTLPAIDYEGEIEREIC